MQKKYLRYLVIAFTIAAFGLLFIISYYQIHQPIAQTPEKTQHPVLIVDFDADKNLNEKDLLLSQDAILAIRPPTKTGAPNDQAFNSLDALKGLDINKDKRLDKKDPMFKYIELVFFTEQGKGRNYVPLVKANIDAIILMQSIRDISNYKNNPLVGYAVKSNGEKVEIRLVPISF